MRTTIFMFALAGLAACEWNDKPSFDDASTGPRPDVRINPNIDADIDAPDMPTGHLYLSEVAMQPPGGEFIEIFNPTADAVTLSNYFLADVGDYWRLPQGVPAISTTDFIVRFPANSTIAAGAAITVATGSGTTFNTLYGKLPTYSIADMTITRTDVPGTPTITDAGETIVLFYWDGTSDLVKDVDIMVAGVPSAQNQLVSKSGMTAGSSMYATDANTIPAQTAAPGNGVSTKRIADEAGHETQDGDGNGITGDDETSEDIRMTWDSTFTAPTPNVPPTL